MIHPLPGRLLFILFLAGSPLAAGCAEAAPFNPDKLPAAELTGVQAACRTIMRLDPGEAHEVGCFESLSRTLAHNHVDEALAQARTRCLAEGMRPRTGDFAVCVLQRGDSARPVPVEAALIQPADVPGGARSFAMTSNGDRRRREELACASLGLDPTDGAFDGCVAGLAATMFALDNPSP